MPRLAVVLAACAWSAAVSDRVAVGADWLWTGTGGIDWSIATNWDTGTVPVGGTDTRVFFNGAAAHGSPVQDIMNPLPLNRMSFAAGSGNFDMLGFTTEFRTSSGGEQALLHSAGTGNRILFNSHLLLADDTVVRIDMAGGNVSFNRQIDGAGRLIKTGAGTLVLSTLNGHASTDIGNGTVAIADARSLGGGTLRAFQDGGPAGLRFDAAGLNVANDIEVLPGQNLDVILNGFGGTLSGSISGPGGITANGSGTLRLTGTSTASILSIRGPAAVAVGSPSAIGAFLQFWGGTLRAEGQLTLTQPVEIVAGSTGTIDTDGFVVESTGPLSGAGRLIKTGAGTLVLHGAGTSSGGTAVTAGTLQVDSLAFSGPLWVEAGGTLSGAGIVVGNVHVASGGTLDPGSDIGTLTVATLEMEPDSVFRVGFEGTGTGMRHDQLVVTSGSVDISGATLQVMSAGGPPPGTSDVMFIIDNQTGSPVAGRFSGLAQGDVLMAGGQAFRISYEADISTGSPTGGDDVALMPVPEPGPVGSVMIAVAVGTLVRRRRLGRRGGDAVCSARPTS